MRVLITGGAGFIGSHVADELLAHGHTVRALDCLLPQIHGPEQRRPAYLDPEVDLIVGDVRDPAAVRSALHGVDAVIHLAAAVGVGQSMYRIHDYTSTNNLGTAVLLEALAERPLHRLIVASSMSIYGEGSYAGDDGCTDPDGCRSPDQLARGRWDPLSETGQPLTPLPTPETKPPDPCSVYALSKYDQERLCLIVGRAYRIPAVALRMFNVYGPRQALTNPYTGALAIFASRYLNGRPPLIFEDGRQQRDFVSVHDVARGYRLALERPEAIDQVFNLGSGEAHAVLEVATELGDVLGAGDLRPEITHQHRAGDVRHCFADIGKARGLLGYQPRIRLRRGLTDLAGWLEGQIATDGAEAARCELLARGLSA